MVDLVGVELIRISIFPSVHRQVHYSLLKTFGGGLPQALSEVAWRWRIEGNELRERGRSSVGGGASRRRPPGAEQQH